MKLSMGFVQEKWGTAKLDADGGITYDGPKKEVLRAAVEEYRASSNLDGGELFEAIHDAPKSYVWTKLEY